MTFANFEIRLFLWFCVDKYERCKRRGELTKIYFLGLLKFIRIGINIIKPYYINLEIYYMINIYHTFEPKIIKEIDLLTI